jgi:hypothetical protein
MRKNQGTTTIGPDITNNFIKEVDSYIKNLSRALSGDPILGSVMPMPTQNTSDILEKYITLGTNQLASTGLHRGRGKSIAKYTLEKILEEKLQEVSF